MKVSGAWFILFCKFVESFIALGKLNIQHYLLPIVQIFCYVGKHISDFVSNRWLFLRFFGG